jgi:uncharacterized protein (TIGR02147 family)
MDSSFVIKVLQGNLHISQKKIEKFISLLELNRREGEYFENLVYFGKAKTEKERKLYFEKLLEQNVSPQKRLTKSQYKFFQKWYNSAIWSLLNYYTFSGDFKGLACKLTPQITVKEAKESIKLLETLKLIAVDKTGLYKVTNQNITTGQEWDSIAIRKFQEEMIHKAFEALERFPKTERNISTVTMNLPEEMLPIVEEMTNKYRKSLIQLANSCENEKSTNRVFQLNIQLFPLSEKEV